MKRKKKRTYFVFFRCSCARSLFSLIASRELEIINGPAKLALYKTASPVDIWTPFTPWLLCLGKAVLGHKNAGSPFSPHANAFVILITALQPYLSYLPLLLRFSSILPLSFFPVVLFSLFHRLLFCIFIFLRRIARGRKRANRPAVNTRKNENRRVSGISRS